MFLNLTVTEIPRGSRRVPNDPIDSYLHRKGVELYTVIFVHQNCFVNTSIFVNTFVFRCIHFLPVKLTERTANGNISSKGY